MIFALVIKNFFQMDRLTKADVLVKDLYVENGQLVAACQNLEQRYSTEKTKVSSFT